MNLIRRPLTDEFHDMNQLLRRFLSGEPLRLADAADNGEQSTLARIDWSPSVDVEETDHAYTIMAELPQVEREDVTISVADGVLALSGERRHEKETKGKKYHRIERSYGSFARSFRLPDNVDEAGIEAQFDSGVLNIVLPKAATPKQNVRQIPVG